ncbi:hypothetical protein [Candidatus Nitrospira bockiana]
MICPVCEHEPFFHTGAFWQCAQCGYMVTSQAMRRAEKQEPRQAMTPRPPPDRP